MNIKIHFDNCMENNSMKNGIQLKHMGILQKTYRKCTENLQKVYRKYTESIQKTCRESLEKIFPPAIDKELALLYTHNMQVKIQKLAHCDKKAFCMGCDQISAWK